ncbi:MAG: hypothetical protein PVH47_04880 [Thiohalocapsa sp.]|jgi:hypothetical protein
MEKDKLDDAYHEINQRPCVFEKAVLSRRCACSKGQRFCLAEREGIGCGLVSARLRCQSLLDHMRHNARFALQLQTLEAPLPHAKALRLQTGGLLGLQRVLLAPAEPGDEVTDVHGLVSDAIAQFGDLERLPYAEMLRDVSSFQARARRHRPGVE